MVDVEDKRPEHRIRSFARRQGRITVAQERALERLWPRYGLEPTTPYRSAPDAGRLVVEIGFGDGEALLHMAMAEPACHFLGIEVHRPGIGHLLMRAEQANLENLKVYAHDAIDILEEQIEDHSIDRLQLFFPDPWHKSRHHKRRIVKAPFLRLVAKKLKAGGVFHAATDWEDYAEDMARHLTESGLFTSTRAPSPYSERPEYRPKTKFEDRGERLGHSVWDLIWISSIPQRPLPPSPA